VAAFSGDTTTNDALWEALNACPRLDLLIVDASFPDELGQLAKDSQHYCPRTLAADLDKLRHDPPIHLTHMKPGYEAQILAELETARPARRFVPLVDGAEFQL
jgi:3',5'-cyclic-nucleotide phosphodiesterase